MIKLLLGCFLIGTLSATAQLNSEQGINIKVTTEGPKVLMECTEGCAWKELSFILFSGQGAKFVDYYGQTSTLGSTAVKTDNENYFSFSVSRGDLVIKLKAITGLRWEEVVFAPEGTITRSGVRTSR